MVDKEAVLRKCCGVTAREEKVAEGGDIQTKDSQMKNSQLGFPTAKICYELLTYFNRQYIDWGFPNGAPLHDPCAVFYVIHPEKFPLFKECYVHAECKSDFDYGATVCDLFGQSEKKPNCKVLQKMDVKGFWDCMLRAIWVGSMQGMIA